LTRDWDVEDTIASDETHAEQEEERDEDHSQLALLGLLLVALATHKEVGVVGKDVKTDINTDQEDGQVAYRNKDYRVCQKR